jgi:protein tyrosine phosphatase (PTP) superfamily phosphohydrolase (DUF442 family)
MNRALILVVAFGATLAHALDAPNIVTVAPGIVTAGQPTAQALTSLHEEGFTAVVYLVPPGASDAVVGEADIVRGQGMDFTQLPMRWEQPTDADFDAFAAAMTRMRDGKVLVHCQINLRASTMTFLYRAITLREPVDKAYDNVTAVWSPNAVWKRYIAAQLARAGIAFEPY